MTPRVLLIGAHGKVSILLTPMLLARPWHVTRLIRDASETDGILSQRHGGPGQLDVFVQSIVEVKSNNEAQKVLDQVKPDYVVWSAGNTALLKVLLQLHRHSMLTTPLPQEPTAEEAPNAPWPARP